MTGADSPVMAASLTEAMPSITSPSPGMMSPASTSTRSPTLGSGRTPLETRVVRIKSRLARVSVRVWRNVSACALPRPSATASAKLANSTVNHSQITIWNLKTMLRAAGHDVADQHDGGERGDDLEHEHHRVLHQRARIELDEGRADRGHHDLRIEQGRDRHALAQLSRFPWMTPSNSLRTACRRASRDARRSGRARAPGRR